MVQFYYLTLSAIGFIRQQSLIFLLNHLQKIESSRKGERQSRKERGQKSEQKRS